MMKAKSKTTTKKLAVEKAAVLQTERDFKDALLLVSLTANVFALSLWVAMKATSQYDSALMTFFFGR